MLGQCRRFSVSRTQDNGAEEAPDLIIFGSKYRAHTVPRKLTGAPTLLDGASSQIPHLLQFFSKADVEVQRTSVHEGKIERIVLIMSVYTT